MPIGPNIDDPSLPAVPAMDSPHGMARYLGKRAGGDDNLGPYLNRVIWSLGGVTTLFVALRIYSKVLRRRQLWWDDHVLIASWVRIPSPPCNPLATACDMRQQRTLPPDWPSQVALIFSIAMQSVAVSHGLGRHYVDLTVEQLSFVSMYSIIAGFGSILTTCWSKTSFALSLLRISTGKLRIAIWAIIISVNIVLGSNGLLQWIQCWPIPKRWHYDTIEGRCFPSLVIQNYNTFFAGMDFGDSPTQFRQWD